MITFKEILEEINEGAKGSIQPHVAARYLSANRRNAYALKQTEQPVKIVRLNKNGVESKMSTDTSYFESEKDAEAKVTYWRSVNPGTRMIYQMYVDGKPVKSQAIGINESTQLTVKDIVDDLGGLATIKKKAEDSDEAYDLFLVGQKALIKKTPGAKSVSTSQIVDWADSNFTN